jgi:membrane protease subunit (stomatin/prohibitin family)
MLSEFSTIIHESLKDHFNDFGMTLDHFAFHSVNVPDEDLRIINEAKIARKKKLIEAEGTAGEMDLLSEAEARKRQREGYTYQQERSFDVMGAAAKNEGTSSTFMGAGMGLGMGFGMGGAIREGMGEVVQNSIGSATAPQSKGNTCPKCGAACVEGAKFCLECGEKLAVAGVICPYCGKELPAGAKFCFECGQKLLSACPNCGKELVPGAKFCLECGTKI